MAVVPALDTDLRLGRCTALVGANGGKYPSGNSLLVTGSEGVVLIDPSITVTERGGAPEAVDRILVSHAHEDHVAGISVFPDAKVHAHHEDVLGIRSVDGLLQVYGFDDPAYEASFCDMVRRDFTYTERPDAEGFADGDVFDLGAGLQVSVVHLAGHTRGHSGFLVEQEGVFFVGDIDLTGFGPYYGDHWSDLEDFERALARVREFDAKWYVTFHQKGVIEGRTRFLEMLDAFTAVIGSREARLLEYLREPHTLDEIAEHGFVYRPETRPDFARFVERRSMAMHVRRLLRDGGVVEIEPGRYRAT
jgi:glyoxylase-like metal-dependent hydrolase (beta-lactamase superfamily II)